jgi:hypothetical protein
MPSPAYDLPAFRVAVVQDESETLHNPTLDVMGALGDRERWRCQLFNERTFDSLLAAQAEFDCIVLGPNVVYRNPRMWAAIADVKVGLLMLHQLGLPEGADTQSPLGFSLIKLERAGSRHPVSVTAQREPTLEVLFNWPETIEPRALTARTGCVLQPAPDTAWRPVLEVEGARPVLLRSPVTGHTRIVACGLLLDSGTQGDRDLLRNMVVYCAAGPPTAVVLTEADSPWGKSLPRKLRLRGLNAVGCESQTPELHLERWPLRAASDVIVPRDLGPIPGQANWLKGGGRLTAVEKDTGQLHVHYCAPDADWVARSWSAWAQTAVADKRKTSVMAARAYHRTLAALRERLGADLSRFGLSPLAEYVEETRTLIKERLKTDDNLEETIGATTALLELGRLVPGSMDAAADARVVNWLREEEKAAGAEDQLEISRVLRDPALLETSLPNLRRPLSASSVARVRRAALACERLDIELTLDESDRELIGAEVATSVLAAADYLSSLAEVCAQASADGCFGSDDALLADAAVDGLLRHGTLGGMEPTRARTAEEVCADALAFVEYLALGDVPTSALVRSETAPPAPFVEDVLKEGLKVRNVNVCLRAENARLEEARKQSDERLDLARGLLGIAVVALAMGVAGFSAWLGAEWAPGGVLAFAPPFLAFLAVGPLMIALLGFPLARHGLCPPWLVTVGRTVGGGVDGVRSFALGVLGRATGEDETQIRQ